jgi:hypothetical protein
MAGSAPPGSAMMPSGFVDYRNEDVTLTEATWPRRTRAVPWTGSRFST